MTLVSLAARALSSLAVVGASLWLVPALWFRLPGPEGLRTTVAALAAVLGLVCVIALWWPQASAIRWRLMGSYLMLLVASLAWWASITPRADRDWAPEVAHLVEGQVVTPARDEASTASARPSRTSSSSWTSPFTASWSGSGSSRSSTPCAGSC